ncbi:MAG: SUMF1/EgtB/PvdO family nonheme iron enzyme [Pseudomonadota bacterium]
MHPAPRFRSRTGSRSSRQGKPVGTYGTGAPSRRVLRGGSWNNTAVNARSANRNNNTPDNRNTNIGVRLASTRVPEPAWGLPTSGEHSSPAGLGPRGIPG